MLSLKYTIKSELTNKCVRAGDGAFSSVWKVKRKSDGIEYALKKVSGPIYEQMSAPARADSSRRNSLPSMALGRWLPTAISKFRLGRQNSQNADTNSYQYLQVKMGNLSQKEKENALNEVRILASIE